ncbi:MAG TPA: hypothetical protein VFL81_01885, partial [Candidatus Saccharimonadales bacterium]|nr:hypothetical protein [Candidatus Saccharimonadales bacterium]
GISARYGWMGRQGLGSYYSHVGFAILAAIMLHPGLLIWQLWHDGFGLPPESYLQHYVAPSMRFAALVGSTCLFIFLAYEFHRWFSGRRWWKIVEILTDAAMIGIFYHSLRLGTQINGWFEIVWWFYGITLIIMLADKYVRVLLDRPLTRQS